MKRFFGTLLLFILTIAAVGGSRLLRLKNPHAIYSPEKQALYLYQPMNLEHLSVLLADSLYVVKDKNQLIWAAKMLGWNSFKAGHYTIDGGFTYNQFLSKVAKGAQDPIAVTILPGSMEEEILSTLAKEFKFDSAAVHTVISDSTFLSKHGVTTKTLIGHLYPETYKFYWTESPKEVLDEIFNTFHEVIQPYKNRSQQLDKSLKEIITLASIVEWEAVQDSAKPIISGLYWNRLQSGMLLQADPTVNFAVGKRRRLFFKDYEVKSPYNTYIHPGLPPGPITNPDLSSIKAALFPADHNYLYMVAKPSGGHAFSKTYAQHLKKAEEWRKWLQKQVEIRERKENNS